MLQIPNTPLTLEPSSFSVNYPFVTAWNVPQEKYSTGELFPMSYPPNINLFTPFQRTMPHSFIEPSFQVFSDPSTYGYKLLPEAHTFVVPQKQSTREEITIIQNMTTTQLTHHIPLKIHEKKPIETELYVCKWGSCSGVFSTKTGLATHMASHLELFPQTNKAKKAKLEIRCLWRDCPECNTDFVDTKLLARHLATDTHVGQMPFVPKAEGQEEDDLSHAKSKKAKRFSCGFTGCNKIFNDSSNRKKHEKTHDANRERFHCPEEGCTKSYSTRTDLNIHLKIHRGEFTHKCTHPTCTKAFVRLSELYAHERTHDNILPHACEDCGRRFREKSRLKKHILTHKK